MSRGDNSDTPSLSNRFSILDTEETTPSKRSLKPPAIHLREPTSTELVEKIVSIIGGNTFSVAFVKQANINETKMQVKMKTTTANSLLS